MRPAERFLKDYNEVRRRHAMESFTTELSALLARTKTITGQEEDRETLEEWAPNKKQRNAVARANAEARKEALNELLDRLGKLSELIEVEDS